MENLKFSYGDVSFSVDSTTGSLIIFFKGNKKEEIPIHIAEEIVSVIKYKQTQFEESQKKSFWDTLKQKKNSIDFFL